MARYIAQQVNIPVFLMDRPWNRSMVSIQMIHRCFGWLDMLHKIDAYHRSIHPLPIGYLKGQDPMDPLHDSAFAAGRSV